MIYRRHLLRTIGSATLIGTTAGCLSGDVLSGDASEGQGCQTAVVEQGDAEIVRAVSVKTDDGDAILDATIDRAAATENGVVRLEFETNAGEGGQIPLTEADSYAFNLGPLPTHGAYVLAAMDDSRTVVDFMEFEFNCPQMK